MTQATAARYKSPLHKMTQTTPTCLWNDSASVQELTYSIEHGAVGATCNPVIVLGVLKKEIADWKSRHRIPSEGISFCHRRRNCLENRARDVHPRGGPSASGL